jgi:hypothetical protein
MIHFTTVLSSQPRSYEWFFTSPFPIKILCTYLLSPIRATRNVYLVLLDSITRGMKTWSSSLFHFLHYPPPSYTSPITLSIFKYNHLLPRLSFTTILKIPTLVLAIHRNSDVSFIEPLIETSLSQFAFHCVSAHKFWLHLNFLCSISFTFKVMSEIKSHTSRNDFLVSCYSRSFLWWQKQPQLGIFMDHGPASINMFS